MGSDISDKTVSGETYIGDDLRLFQNIVEHISSAVFIFQGEKMCYVNPSALSITGYSKEELLVMPFRAIIHKDFQEMVKQRGRSRQAGDDVPDHYELKIVRKDGEHRWVNFRASIIELDGKPAVLGLAEEITERIRNGESLKQNEYQQLVSNKLGLDALAGLQLDELFQKTAELIAATLRVEYCKILELQPDGKALLLRAGVGWKAGLVGHAVVGTELESQAGFTLKSSHPVIIKDLSAETRFSGPPLLREHGVISGISVIIGSMDRPWGVLGAHTKAHRDFSELDINFIQSLANTLALAIERKQTEQALYESEKKYRGMVMNLMEGFYRVTLDGKLQDYNIAFTKILGLDPNKDYTGIEFPIFWQNPEGRKDYASEIKTHGFIKNYTVHAKKLNGEKIILQVSARLLKSENSDPLLIEGSFLDITERKWAEEALHDSRARLAEAQRIGHMGNWEFDVILNTGLYSDETYRIFGVAADYGRSFKSFFRLVHPDDRWLVKQANHKAFETGGFSNVQYRIIHPDGSVRFVQASGEGHRDESGRPCQIFGTIQDITERKQDEAQVRKLSNALTCAGSSIMITNRAGIIEYVNPAFTKITGYSAGDVMGQTPRILNSGNQDAAFYEHLWLTITRGDIWHGKVIDKRKDGSLFPSILTIAPIVDDQSVITHFIGSHADISELEDMEAQFHQAQKMEAIGTLVGGIAHDFNNLLAGMTGNLYLAKMKVQQQPDVVQKLGNIEQLSIRAADMIQQLLTFARKDRVSMKALPFTPFIKETLKFLETSVPENIVIRQDICDEELLLNGDGTQLHQVLMNLINNARDAVEHVHDPRITTRLAVFHADDGWLERHADFTPGNYAHLSVEDNGCGIPEQQIEHLFEPFFTTKEVGKGTGLGLAMVFGAIKTHHGFVEVESVPGEGSSFHIYIPLLERENSDPPSPRQLEVVDGHGEMILLADDEIHILETGKEVLEALGYQVLTASNGQQAVDIFEAHPEAIDLCLFDIVMPILGGDEAANQIRQVKPDAQIIFATGYDKNLQHHLVGETVLSKPFSIVEMSQVIRQQLSG